MAKSFPSFGRGCTTGRAQPWTFFQYNRYLHITIGIIGFFVAPAALAVRKGGKAHRLWGRVFFWAMEVAGTTAIAGAQHIHSLFLLLTAVFSLYMAGFGYRSIFLKPLAWDARVAAFDWAVVGTGRWCSRAR